MTTLRSQLLKMFETVAMSRRVARLNRRELVRLAHLRRVVDAARMVN